MSFDVTIPSLGESVTEATIGRWLKDDGDVVEVDDAILELESDKANMDLAAEQPGVLRILKPAGETVTAGDVVARIEPAEKGKTARDASAGDGAKATRAPAPAAAPSPGGAASGKGAGAPPPPAREPRRETEASLPGKEIEPSEVGIAVERPLSPAVRRIAEEASLDLRGATGTGPGGRITKADARALADAASTRAPAPRESDARAGAPAAAAPSAAPAAKAKADSERPPAPREGEERVRMSRIRQVIARRLVEAQHTAAILTTFNEVDMSAVQEIRARFKESFQSRHGVALGFMSFFVKACCDAATRVPELNAEIQGDEIVYRRHVHMGVAVGSEKGLVVPVVRDADRLSFAEIEKEIARLAGLARDSKLSVDDLSGATFTISNGGVYGSLLSTPILNPPQSGILGMHKIEKRPVVVADEIVIRPMMYLALSYDHRIVDGKGAVTFLVRVKEALEDPARLLLGA
jgi:2-oxoglutarate dehydrogenase E2 component (dihydrolipoamide succinyltransferase)